MMVFIKSKKGQMWLLPPSIDDLIPEDHICYLVESLVESLDFTSFEIKYSGPGHPAYHPRVLLKLLVMGILDRVRSSRRLARNARENIVYIYLSEKLTPDFRTISDFRKTNPNLVKGLFKHTISLAKKEGMLDLSFLSTDGTKIKANAANKRVITKEELAFLKTFLDEELEEWAKQDLLEDNFFNDIRGSDQLPEKSKKKIKKAVEYYIKEMKEKGDIFKEKTEKKLDKALEELDKHNLKNVSLTDPESRFMKSKKGKIELSYNPQITTEKNGFILANDVCQSATDVNQLQPQVLHTEKNLDGLPEDLKWCFDNGYYGSENIKFLDNKKIDAYIPSQKETNSNFFHKSNFAYDKNKDEYICPESQSLTFLGEHFDKQKKKKMRIYKGTACKNCTRQKLCTKTKGGIRYLKEFPHRAEREALKEKMQTQEAKKIYKLRQQIVEPAIGDIKENKGLRAFITRSLETVKTEFNLVCTANNLKKIWIHLQKNNNTNYTLSKLIQSIGRNLYLQRGST